jgi:hypothetical protein
MDILIGLDGTHPKLFGAMAEAEYRELFKTSHVRHITTYSRWPQTTLYVRGPDASATRVIACFNEALGWLTPRLRAASGPVRLHLAGYSRGAAIALDLANLLSPRPKGWLGELRLVTAEVSFGIASALAFARDAAADRLTIASLALFDPVDMSGDIDGHAIGAGVGPAVVARRCPAWGSRLGWTNVGDTMERGGSALRVRRVFRGTHSALGGMPRAGDIPRGLAQQLLRTVRSEADWQRVDRRFLGESLSDVLVKAAYGRRGLFVHPQLGAFIGPAAAAAVRLAKLPREVRLAVNSGSVYRQLLREYVDRGSFAKGTVGVLHDIQLGSMPGIDAFFLDHKGALDIIDAARRSDDLASQEARTFVRQQLGRNYPATR